MAKAHEQDHDDDDNPEHSETDLDHQVEDLFHWWMKQDQEVHIPTRGRRPLLCRFLHIWYIGDWN